MPRLNDIYFGAVEADNRNATAVVLIHGAGGNYHHWPSHLRRLSGYRVFALDLPAHGKSGGVASQRIEKYTRYVIQWLKEARIYKAVFIGHSMGGAITQTLAVHYPEYVLGIGLVGTGASLPVNPNLLYNLSTKSTFPVGVKMITSWSFRKNVSQQEIKDLQTQLLTNRHTVLHADYAACDHFSVLESLNRVQAPALIVCGKEDRMTPPHYSIALHDKISESELLIVPDAGHMVMQEKPVETTQAVLNFLKRVDSKNA